MRCCRPRRSAASISGTRRASISAWRESGWTRPRTMPRGAARTWRRSSAGCGQTSTDPGLRRALAARRRGEIVGERIELVVLALDAIGECGEHALLFGAIGRPVRRDLGRAAPLFDE